MVQFGPSQEEMMVSWASLAYFIIDGIAPAIADTQWRSNQTKTVQFNFILTWKTLLWGLPLAPVDSIYTLFSEVWTSENNV